jgi:hypothetical protein
MQNSIIRNVTVNYAKLYKAETNQFGNTQFDIQLEFNRDRIDELKEFGKIRELPNGNFAMNISLNEKNREGKLNTVRVVDAAKEPMSAPIGNGSTANLIVFTYASPRAYNGKKTILKAVQITNLIEYTPENTVDFDLVESTNTTTESATDF